MPVFDPQLLRSPQLVQKVLKVLSALHPLPATGVVAGQSVASALDYVLKTGTPVFNDIDVFLDHNEAPPAAPSGYTGGGSPWFTSPVIFCGKESRLTPNFRRADEGLDADYSPINTYQRFYRIRATRRDELLNTIQVEYNPSLFSSVGKMPLPLKEERRAQALILGFDINATQVGINLATEEMYFTAEFVKYFSTRQLEIVAMFTPVHTVLRYFKKRQELQCYGDDNNAVQLLAARLQQVDRCPELGAARARAFCKGRATLSDLNKRLLKKSHPSEVNGPVGSLAYDTPMILGERFKDLMDRYGAPVRTLVSVLPHPAKPLWLIATKSSALALTRSRMLPWHASTMVERFQEQTRRPSKQVVHRLALFEEWVSQLPNDLETSYRKQFVERGPAYIEGIESPLRAMVARLVAEHSELECLVELSFKNQIAFVQQARSGLEAINMPNAWGVFARKGSRWMQRALYQPEILRSTLVSIIPSLTPVAERLPLPATIQGATVLELLSGHALKEEGYAMRHCVGGYTGNVAAGHSRIISLKLGYGLNHRSTTEWGFEEHRDAPVFAQMIQSGLSARQLPPRLCRPLMAILRQTRSYRNDNPCKELLAAELTLREQFNVWSLAHPWEGWRVVRPLYHAQLQPISDP